MPTDISTYGSIRSKSVNTKNIKSGFQGASPSVLNLRSNNKSEALNELAYTNAELKFVTGGNSTLKFVEWESDGVVGGNAVPQEVSGTDTRLLTKIEGVKDPVLAQDVATKKYVDDKLSDFVTIYNPVKAISTQNLSGIPNYAAYATTGGKDGRPCIKFDVAASGPVTVKVDGVSITIDGAVVGINESVLLMNTAGANTANTGEGVYEITTIQSSGGQPDLTFTRRADMLGPLKKGAFVLVDPGSIHSGNGYYLTIDVAGISALRLWSLFSSSESRLFGGVITERDDGKWSVSSNVGGGDEKKLLVVGSDIGKAVWSYEVGKTGAAFGINGTGITLNDNQKWTNNSVGLTFSTPVFAFHPDATIQANDRIVNVIGTSGTCSNSYLGNTLEFATLSEGTPARSLSLTTADSARIDGHVTALTNAFGTSGAHEWGAGLLFDTNNVTTGGGSTNKNTNRFLMAPHKNTTNGITLDVVSYVNNDSGHVIAEFGP